MKTLIALLLMASVAYANTYVFLIDEEGKATDFMLYTEKNEETLQGIGQTAVLTKDSWGELFEHSGMLRYVDGDLVIDESLAPIVYNADEFIAWCMENVLTIELQPHYFALLSAANKDTKGGWDNFIAYCNMVGQSELGQTIINEAELRGANV